MWLLHGLGFSYHGSQVLRRGHFERKHLGSSKRTGRFKGREHITHLTMGGVSKNLRPYFKSAIVIDMVGIDSTEADIW